MNEQIKTLKPQALWTNFAKLNAVPRPSKKEERVIEFMMNFGKALGLETSQDAVGNVLIKKPASKGMEDRKTVVLQSHLDMVHQKNNDTDFDFDTQGIEMYVEGDWVKAKGTTLGADNGLGVAAIMSILESKDIAHPAIEALFTIDEETGMTGAMGLEAGVLSGDILLNLDTEDDDELSVGCAGGIDLTATRNYEEEAVDQSKTAYTIEIKGLSGGHSGMDIHKGLGNANKIMNRLLFDGYENYGLRIAQIHGGSLRNAIPRESHALVVVDQIQAEAFEFEFKLLAKTIKKEQKKTDPNLKIKLSISALPSKVMDLGVQEGFLKTMYSAHNGVYRMSPDIADLVETSNNIARVSLAAGFIQVLCLTRSSVESTKIDLSNALRAAFELSGMEVELSGSYPGWQPDMGSSILKEMKALYIEMFQEEPNIMACHAGLECGLLGTHYPEMEMISFGPNIRGAHSPDEKASISSSQKFWSYLLKTLENIPSK
ncbi:MAG: aminoacyl-histidine dipeptidase [Flavobacteriaceae bacterium]